MEDKIFNYISKKLIEDSVVGIRTQGRIHSGHIIAVPQPTYPCVTFERLVPGYTMPYAPLQDFDIVLTVYSDNSFDEANIILTGIQNVLNYVNASESNTSWVIRPTNSPIQDAQRVEKPVFYLKSFYRIFMVN